MGLELCVLTCEISQPWDNLSFDTQSRGFETSQDRNSSWVTDSNVEEFI